MPVEPPYQIIDTIARLRAQGNDAWGKAASSVGQNLGSSLQRGGEDERSSKAKAYHDATLAWDQNYEGHQFIPPKPATPGPGTAGGPLRSEQPSPMQSILQPAPNAPAMSSQPPAMNSYQPTEGAPATPGSQSEGMMSLADFYKSRGLQPPRGSENIWGKPKTQVKSESAANVADIRAAGEKERADAKAKADKEKQDAADATKVKVAKIAAGSKEATANIVNDTKMTIADKASALKKNLTETVEGTKEHNVAKKAWADYQKAHPYLGELGMGPDNPDAGGASKKKTDPVEDLLSGH